MTFLYSNCAVAFSSIDVYNLKYFIGYFSASLYASLIVKFRISVPIFCFLYFGLTPNQPSQIEFVSVISKSEYNPVIATILLSS